MRSSSSSEIVIFQDVCPIRVGDISSWDISNSAIFEAGGEGSVEVRSPAVDYWVEFRVSLYAASRMFLTPWRRWFCEVSARRTDWPYPSESFWTHYCTYDFYATSLRSAFLKAARQAEKLWDDMLADPDLRPEPAEKLMAPWVSNTPGAARP